MEYKRFDNRILVRMDKDEEIVTELKKVCEAEEIKLAFISAIGAVKKFTVGVFKTAEKEYCAHCFEGDYEIVSLTGTVTTKQGAFYAHLHLGAADAEGNMFGGHLNEAVVSATCEMTVAVVDGRAEREYDRAVGLNLIKF